MAKDSILNWQTIDVASLSPQAQGNHAAYKAAYSAMKDARTKFEQGLNDETDKPTGTRLVFGYNFGKLSIALAPDDAKPKAAAKPTLSLAAWAAAQRDSGRGS